MYPRPENSRRIGTAIVLFALWTIWVVVFRPIEPILALLSK
jgi:hypothetical protein